MTRAADNRQRGFILLPVVIAFTLIAVIALLLNRDSGMNLSRAARGLQADDARYVAEAGLAQASYRAQNSDCANYPALTNVAFGTDSFTASATPTSGSPVTLSATATTATGATATLARSGVSVYYTTPRTTTLQPATLLRDTYLNADETSRNYGASTTLKLQDGKFYPLLRFDLSSIPVASIVQSAQLMLYKIGGGSGGVTITAYPLTRAWVEGTLDGSSPADGATWNTANGITAWTTPGGDYDSSVNDATTGPGGGNTWLSWDVTKIVKNWVGGASVNNGVILIPSGNIPGQTYVSGNDTSQRANTPKLVITYLPRCDWTPPPSVVTLPAAADAYIDGNNQFLNYGITTSLPMAEQPKQRVVVRFDTSGITPGTLLGSATLRYYVSGISNRTGSTMNLEAHALTRAWAEGIMNGGLLGDVSWKNATLPVQWANSGGDYAGANAATLALPSTFNSGWIEFNITALAQAWIDGVQANYGVILLEKTNDVLALNSREAASNPPQLVLTW